MDQTWIFDRWRSSAWGGRTGPILEPMPAPELVLFVVASRISPQLRGHRDRRNPVAARASRLGRYPTGITATRPMRMRRIPPVFLTPTMSDGSPNPLRVAARFGTGVPAGDAALTDRTADDDFIGIDEGPADGVGGPRTSFPPQGTQEGLIEAAPTNRTGPRSLKTSYRRQHLTTNTMIYQTR
jgi:hypothetical protein